MQYLWIINNIIRPSFVERLIKSELRPAETWNIHLQNPV